MDSNDRHEEICPFMDRACPVQEEVDRLREKVRLLEELSQRDHLTGLFNFRYLMDALDGEMERTRRTGLAVSLLIGDLDHFKRVNDTYGHEAGNEALKWATSLWVHLLRRIDIPCRYGGEEFAMILPGTRLGQAVLVAERLRKALQDSPVPLEETRLSLTVSFGVDCYEGEGSLRPRGFLERTDRFLLVAKDQGRNRVCYDEKRFAPEPTEVSPKEREALMAGKAEEEGH